MAVFDRRMLPEELPKTAPFDPDDPSQTDPITGQTLGSYRPIPVAPRMSTQFGLDSQLSRDRDPAADYRRAQAQSSLITDGGSPGFGLSHESDTTFATTGRLDPDSNRQSATVTGGEDHLITRRGTVPSDTNLQSAGKTVL